MTVLLCLWRPNGGGLAITNALARVGGEMLKENKQDGRRGEGTVRKD